MTDIAPQTTATTPAGHDTWWSRHPLLGAAVTLALGLIAGGGVVVTLVQSHSNERIAKIQSEGARTLEKQKAAHEREVKDLEEQLDKRKQRTATCLRVGAAASQTAAALDPVQAAAVVEGGRVRIVDAAQWQRAVKAFQSESNSLTTTLAEFYAYGGAPPRADNPAVILNEIKKWLRTLPQTGSVQEWDELEDRKAHIAGWTHLLPTQCAAPARR